MGRGILEITPEFLEAFFITGTFLEGIAVQSSVENFRIIDAETVMDVDGRMIYLRLLVESQDIPEVGLDESLPEMTVNFERTK